MAQIEIFIKAACYRLHAWNIGMDIPASDLIYELAHLYRKSELRYKNQHLKSNPNVNVINNAIKVVLILGLCNKSEERWY